MRRLRTRMIVSHLLPLMLVLPVIGFALMYLLETQVLVVTLSRELERQAVLVSAIARDEPEIWYDSALAGSFVSRVGPLLSAHITLLEPSGLVVATNDPSAVDLVGKYLAAAGLSEVLLSGKSVRIDYGEQPGTGAAEAWVPVYGIDFRMAGVIRLTDPLSSVYGRFPRTRTLIFGVLAAGLALGGVIGWWLALDLERPLRRATKAIDRLAEGRSPEPLVEQGPDEIRRLLRAFNALVARLQTLEKARERLLANLVHELGRPLGALLSAIQALSGGADEDSALRHELVSGMEGEIQRMQRLLEELTQLHSQTMGPLELQRQRTALASWLVEVSVPWREAAQQQGILWETLWPEDLPVLLLDRDRLGQALGNVLSNAIKYTPTGGVISVSAGWAGSESWIKVQDTGPGIPVEEQERIFAPFYRGSVGKRFPQGMGLGLSIARDLVAAHGGRLELESAPGKGSLFIFWLPLEAK